MPIEKPSWSEALMRAGLAGMAAAGVPGATTAGALGAGGLAGLDHYEGQKRDINSRRSQARAEQRADDQLRLQKQNMIVNVLTRRAEINARLQDSALDRGQREILAAEERRLQKLIAELADDTKRAGQDQDANQHRDMMEWRNSALDVQSGNQQPYTPLPGADGNYHLLHRGTGEVSNSGVAAPAGSSSSPDIKTVKGLIELGIFDTPAEAWASVRAGKVDPNERTKLKMRMVESLAKADQFGTGFNTLTPDQQAAHVEEVIRHLEQSEAAAEQGGANNDPAGILDSLNAMPSSPPPDVYGSGGGGMGPM
jgi:hypothetical protein